MQILGIGGKNKMKKRRKKKYKKISNDKVIVDFDIIKMLEDSQLIVDKISNNQRINYLEYLTLCQFIAYSYLSDNIGKKNIL